MKTNNRFTIVSASPTIAKKIAIYTFGKTNVITLSVDYEKKTFTVILKNFLKEATEEQQKSALLKIKEFTEFWGFNVSFAL